MKTTILILITAFLSGCAGMTTESVLNGLGYLESRGWGEPTTYGQTIVTQPTIQTKQNVNPYHLEHSRARSIQTRPRCRNEPRMLSSGTLYFEEVCQ